MLKICLIDTCVLIDIYPNAIECSKIFNYLKFEGYNIIIPIIVQKEFTCNHPSKKKKLNKLIKNYQLQICDIRNNINEINQLPIDEGEADAFLQIQKKIRQRIQQQFLFITNDKNAKKYFEQNSILTYTLRDLKDKLHI